jgi:ABC-type transporter Mla subunit MlaD
VVGVCVAAFLTVGAADKGSADGATYKIQFDNAFGLVEGGEFRIAGVKAGSTSGFNIVKTKNGYKAEVTVTVSESGFAPLRSDASCDIRPQSLIGEYYVDCQPGSKGKELSKDGGVLTVQHNTSTVPQDLVNDIMRRPYRERLRLIITDLGTGLAGRPQELQNVIRRASPGLRETSKTLRILGNQNRIIENFITDADTSIAELERNKRDVARWVTVAANTAEISASRKQAIAQSFAKLPTFLDELKPTMRKLGELADEQNPLLTDTKRAAPYLNTFLSRLGPFSEASRPALRSLGQASEVGTRAFRHGSEEVDVLKTLSKDAPGFAKPLRQFLQTMDQRNRAIENDARAKPSAPPAPDPTAMSGEGGFTGLEALWDYAFWQALDINMVDSEGHIIRTGLTPDPDCSPILNDPHAPGADAKIKKCNAWEGPNQPGVNSRDFTTTPASSSKNAKTTAGGPASSAPTGNRRSPGQPDAPPTPGQPDISKPQITLPPDVKKLLDQLKIPKLPNGLPKQMPQLPNGGDVSRNQLLDFLLNP